MQVIEVVPGTHANEYAVYEILRTPIAIGRAVKRVVGVVSPFAYGRSIVETIVRANGHAKCNLSLRVYCRQRNNGCQQNKILKITHVINPPLCDHLLQS